MPARSFSLACLCCLALCACKPLPPKGAKCSADAGCADAGACPDGAACDASTPADGQADTAAISSRRVSAARAPTDAGASLDASEDAATGTSTQPKLPEKQSNDKARGQQAGAAGSAQKPAQTGKSGAGAPSASCEQSCGTCQACAADNTTCEPVTGADDADSCSDTRTCSSRGMCLNVSEAHKTHGNRLEWSELTTSYAQVINFEQPASVQEIQLEVLCRENDQTFPPVWLVSAPNGVPSNTTIATANVIYQAPTEKNWFALLELSKVIEQPNTGPIAIVVGKTDMECIVRINSEERYPNGGLFMQGSVDLWAPAEGSMVFQVLSSK